MTNPSYQHDRNRCYHLSVSYQMLTSKMLSYFARSVANCFKYCEAERYVASDLDLLLQKLINSAAKTFLKRLQTCISTNGGQSGQLLDQTESRYDKKYCCSAANNKITSHSEVQAVSMLIWNVKLWGCLRNKLNNFGKRRDNCMKLGKLLC